MRFWVVVYCLLAPAIALAASDRVILVFGDSLSTAYGFDVEKGWVSLLKERLVREKFDYRVVNASISGETTRGGRARINDVLEAAGPGIVIVELGGNDGLRGINLDATAENLEAIVKSALEAGAEVLLLAMELPPNYGPSYIERFRQIYMNIAEANEVYLVPFFLEGVADNSNLMQADGIHPKAEAQPQLLENIWPYLKPLLVY
ncbi:MAG TPA: arylesterase [Gammaproteobacteria bacterium]